MNHSFSGVKRFAPISLAGIILPGALGALVSYGLYEHVLGEASRAATPFSSFLLFTFVAMAITVHKSLFLLKKPQLTIPIIQAFPVLARILAEKKLLVTTVGMMTVSAAAVDDICAWVLLALAISIINAGNPFSALYVILTISCYTALLLGPGRMVLRRVSPH